MERNGRRGLALLVVLGALALMSLLAASFAALAGVERRIARNTLDAARAQLAAESGVEAALARIEEAVSRGRAPEPGAIEESFASVRIEDANARINVNDGASWGGRHPVSGHLRRILNALGAQAGVDLPGLGDRILEGRPPQGYLSLDDLPEGCARARRFLTVSSWSDPNVASLVPLSAEAEAAYYPVRSVRPLGPAGPIYRHGHQKNFRGEAIRDPLWAYDPGSPRPHALWGRDSLNPGWIEIVSRSPVNVNLARREVLVALLTGLEGVFLVERPRETSPVSPPSPCRSPGGAYGWTSVRYSYDAAGPDSGECGFLYRTRPLAPPLAEAVADEIEACRSRLLSPRIQGLDYARAPFGGPFRSWAQFHLFCDALVQGGLLADDRTEIFRDAVQLRLASQAIADVLKANFNPNLHLNELNPNRNLFTHVDKTDLVVQSTEFCFTPMGRFEIESTGRHEEATATVEARVLAYDAVRETAQGPFAAGSFGPRRAGPETNNNRSVESGPEPDNGTAPGENLYEGYLQLPTYGSNLSGDQQKPPGALWTTITDPSIYPGATPLPSGGRQLGSTIHAHFQLDHAAHHHAGRTPFTSPPEWEGFRLPQGAWQTVFGRRCLINRNWEDRTETIASPYSPVDSGRAGAQGQRYRLARSFPAASAIEVDPAAPSDLRLDGAYAERHSAFGYWIDENESFNFNEGTVAFWLKPGFFPEATGKRRTLLSASRYHAHAAEVLNPSPFALFLLPSFGAAGGGMPSYAGGLPSFPPRALAFGVGFSSATGYNWETDGETHASAHAFALTPSLEPLRAHEWMHVAVAWKLPRFVLPPDDAVRIYVNGRPVPGAVPLPHLYAPGGETGQPFSKTPRWATHSLEAVVAGIAGTRWCKNSIRLGGEPSKLFDLPGDAGIFPANFSADATFDEFYVWMDRFGGPTGGLWAAQTLWARGRYYRPDDADPRDARFTSRALDLSAPAPRQAPPPGLPGGPPAPPHPAPAIRLLAVAWTEAAEAYDGRPKTFDHSTSPPRELRPAAGPDANGFSASTAADLSVGADGAWYGPFRDEAWSPVRAADGRAVAVADPASVRYAAKLKVGAAAPGAILLSTPVLDDVTLFIDRGGPRVTSWTVRR